MYILNLREYTITSKSIKFLVYKLFYKTNQEYQFQLYFQRVFSIHKCIS